MRYALLVVKRIRSAAWVALALTACGIDAKGLAPVTDEPAATNGDGTSADAGAGGVRDGDAPVADASGGDAGTDAVDASDPGAVGAGSALELDGGDVVEVGALAVPADFTVEAWVKPKTATREQYIVAKDRSGQSNAQFRLGLEDGGRLFFIMSDPSGDDHGLYQGSNYVVRSAAALPMNAWTHVAVTKSGATYTLYAGSAAPVTKTADASFVHASMVSFRIGGRVASNGTGIDGGFDGVIDDVRVWGVARTAAEIAATRSAPPSLSAPGLVTYFRLDEGAGTTTTDAKGALVGTLVGPPSWVTSTAF